MAFISIDGYQRGVVDESRRFSYRCGREERGVDGSGSPVLVEKPLESPFYPQTRNERLMLKKAFLPGPFSHLVELPTEGLRELHQF